ncbi:MAG: outer membrane beta-barrel protein [Verrucomicrobiota bacterium]|nr:outer membrane beta-barrel protein [Verrucomicrobiota bacterium]
MKTSFPVLIFLLSSSFLFVSGKSRIGEYYLGFGYGLINENNKAFEGDSINLFVNSPGSETVDFDLSYTYAGLETNSSRETYWRFGLNLRYHFDDFYDNQGMFRPFLGLGVEYLGDSQNLILEEEGFGWSLEAGTEIAFTQDLSFIFFAKLHGLWKDFSYNDFNLNSELTWWMDDEHAFALSYLHMVDANVDQFILKYMYSWK